MADNDLQNQPAGVQAGQPNGGSDTPAANPEQGKAEDERISLRQRAIEAERKAAKLEAEAKKRDEALMAEQGKWQELAKAKEAEAMKALDELRSERLNRVLSDAGYKHGIRDAGDLVLAKLPDDLDYADPSALAKAADEAVSGLKQIKPYLFGTDNPKTESAQTKPAPPGGGVRADLSKVRSGDVSKLNTEEKKALVASLANIPSGFR